MNYWLYVVVHTSREQNIRNKQTGKGIETTETKKKASKIYL